MKGSFEWFVAEYPVGSLLFTGLFEQYAKILCDSNSPVFPASPSAFGTVDRFV